VGGAGDLLDRAHAPLRLSTLVVPAASDGETSQARPNVTL
jgi:hypothetical protein